MGGILDPRTFPAQLIKLIFIHEAWMLGISLAAGQNIYRDTSGCPIPSYTVSRTCGKWGPIVLEDITLISNLASFDRERVPERAIHALGAGAFGDFVVTHDISQYCKASVFSKVGLKTQVAVRFSTSRNGRSGPDMIRDPRGFAVRFYTGDGNFDIAGQNMPIFYFRDPMLLPAFIHSQRGREPKTNLPNPNYQWDLVCLRHDTLFQVMMLYSDWGTPDGYRYMDGYGVNTFVLINATNQPVYCKFHWKSHLGKKNMTHEDAAKARGQNVNYSILDLTEAINNGDYPSWDFMIQVMTFEQADSFPYSVLDCTKASDPNFDLLLPCCDLLFFEPINLVKLSATSKSVNLSIIKTFSSFLEYFDEYLRLYLFVKLWPEDKYPLIPVGTMTLNRLPNNFHLEIEQLAFSPANLVPGIQPSLDRVLQARLFAYKDSQRHRIGNHFMQVPVNRPLHYPPYNLVRDGQMNMHQEFGFDNNFYPSSFDQARPDPSVEFVAWNTTGPVGRYDTLDEDNFTQAREWYESLSDNDRMAIAKNIAGDLNLKGCTNDIKARTAETFGLVHPELGRNIRLHTKTKEAVDAESFYSNFFQQLTSF
nr:PREDICTED: peroxisomal catalase 1-like [Bemisia tabaci]